MDDLDLSPSSLVNICVDEMTTDSMTARLFTCYTVDPVPISDFCEILFKVDAMLERINYPQSSSIARSFSEKNIQYNREGVGKKMSEATVLRQKGKTATFVIHITHRQSATWQGRVLWTEKNKSQNFRSALELIKLLDSALCPDDSAQEDTMEIRAN